ncbi:MAG TPA: 4-oxalocrotonate tautomerase [Pseudogracilibacillus sp.]|nr:4-oxalocrotonate tautomerase [Pseudogracilibacillus sp.]
MPLVQITIMEGRSDEKKERMIKEVSEAVSNSLDAPMENIRVLINEIPSSHWGIAGQSVAKGRK